MQNFDDGSSTQAYINMVGVEGLGKIYEKLEFADSSNEVISTRIIGPNDSGTWMKDEKLEYVTTELIHHLKIGDVDDVVLFSEELTHPGWTSTRVIDTTTPTITTSHGETGTESVITIDGTGTTTLTVGTNVITVDSEGNVQIDHDTDCTINTGGAMNLTITGETNLTSTGALTLTGGTSMTEINGLAPPNNQGAFCALPACLFTGAPHTGSQAMTNKVEIK